MKKVFALFLMMSIIGSGCLGTIVTEKEPVLYVNVSLDEDSSGAFFAKEVSVKGDEIPKLQAPEIVMPKDFPAYYVDVVQNMRYVNYQNGIYYSGPGNYNFEIGLGPEFNKSMPMKISLTGIDKSGNFSSYQFLYMNWTTDTINKTFK